MSSTTMTTTPAKRKPNRSKEEIVDAKAARKVERETKAARKVERETKKAARKVERETKKAAKVAMSRACQVYTTRISPNNKNAMRDYSIFEEQVRKFGAGLWDKDSKNKMKVGDLWCTVVGETGHETMQIFKLVEDDHWDRESTWKSDCSYSDYHEGGSVEHRCVIRVVQVTTAHLITWEEFHEKTGWKQGYMARRTMRILNSACRIWLRDITN